MTEHTYIYAWNWLYVMDYYKCMLRECGDRIINMHIQDSKGVCEVSVCMYICMYIEVKKGEAW